MLPKTVPHFLPATVTLTGRLSENVPRAVKLRDVVTAYQPCNVLQERYQDH